MVEVRDPTHLACSPEHDVDPFGKWHCWGSFDEITLLLYHTKIRQVFADADTWLQGTKMPSTGTHAHPGLLLVLDGPDGGGKSTQAGRLAEWLRSLGRDVVTCRDPGGTALGERLREILLDRSDVNISLRSEMLLYMASRRNSSRKSSPRRWPPARRRGLGPITYWRISSIKEVPAACSKRKSRWWEWWRPAASCPI